MKEQLDFDTPNETPTRPRSARRTKPGSSGAPRPICDFCFEPGIHHSAAQCLRALEKTTSN
jgi:hypothetical protein